MKASNSIYAAEIAQQIERLQSLGWYHSIELPDGRIILGLQSIEQLNHRHRVIRFAVA